MPRHGVDSSPTLAEAASRAATDFVDAGDGVPTARNILVGARWMTISQLVVQVTRIGVSVLLARLLAPSDFGLLALALVVTQFLDMFVDLGTGSAIVQRSGLTHRMASSVFFLNVGLGVVLAAGMALAAPLIAALYDVPDATPILRGMSVAVMITALGVVQQGLLRRWMKFGLFGIANAATALVTGMLAIPLALAGFGVWALVIGTVGGIAVRTLLVWWFSRWRPHAVFSIADLRSMASFSGNLSLFNLSSFFIANADKFIIGRFLGAAALGLYSLADRALMYPVRSITIVIQELLFPAFSRVQKNDESIRRGYLRACSGIALVTFPAMFGLMVVAGPFVEIVLGEQWIPAIPLVTVLAPVGAIQSLAYTVGVLYRAKGRTDRLLRWGLVSGLVIVAGYVIGLPWGIDGVAYSYGATMFLLSYPAFVLAFALIDLRFADFARALRPYVAATAIMVAATLAIRVALELAGASQATVLAVCVASAALTYCMLMYRSRPAALRDLMSLTGLSRLLSERGNTIA